MKLSTAIKKFITADVATIEMEQAIEAEENFYEQKAMKKQLIKLRLKAHNAMCVIENFEVNEEEFNAALPKEIPACYCWEMLDYNNFF